MEGHMIRYKFTYLAIAAALFFAGNERLHAQTIGYAEVLGELAVSCGKDIARFCGRANLGGGAVAECLEKNQANVSPQCKSTAATTAALVIKRAEARKAVPRVCELDRLQYCGGTQPGDAQILDCMYKSRRVLRPACRQALADSGYEANLDPGPLGSQVHLRSSDILSSLVGVESTAVGLDVARMRQIAAQATHDPSRADPYHRAPLFEQLNTLSQLTIAIEFDFDSARRGHSAGTHQSVRDRQAADRHAGSGRGATAQSEQSQGSGEPARPVDQCRPVAQQPGVSCRCGAEHQVATARTVTPTSAFQSIEALYPMLAP